MGRSGAVPRGGASGEFGPEADDSGCHVLHVDMDAFFASVEVRRHPELTGKPVIVGGTGPRGVVCSASYEARGYGVRSAMPTGMARKLCPRATFLQPDFTAYRAASQSVMGIFRDVTPLVEPLSLDEAFLDVAGAIRLLGSPAAIGTGIRRRIFETLGLRCSVGVAATMHLAKLGSTRAKPDGLVVIPAERALEYLHPLPVSALWGVGERTAEALRRMGLVTVGDIAGTPVRALRSALGVAAGNHLHELASGRDQRRVTPQRQEKSIGAETTFDTDVDGKDVIRQALLELAGKTAVRLRRTGHTGRTVSIKVRYAGFETVTRSQTLPSPTDVAHEIFATAWALFAALPSCEPIRLVGVRAEGLANAANAPRQLVLGAPEHGWRELEQATDAVTARFGEGLVRPASLLNADGRRVDGNGGIPPSVREQ